jgi:hypothetical protein
MEVLIDSQLVRVTIRHSVSLGEVLTLLRREGPVWNGLDELWDLRGGCLRIDCYEQADDFICALKAMGSGKRRNKAAIVTDNKLTWGGLRMLQSLAEIHGLQSQLGIFAELAPALAWLRPLAGFGPIEARDRPLR